MRRIRCFLLSIMLIVASLFVCACEEEFIETSIDPVDVSVDISVDVSVDTADDDGLNPLAIDSTEPVVDEPEPASVDEPEPVVADEPEPVEEVKPEVTYKFRSKKLLDEHYEKHGIEMGFASKDEYVAAANKVINNPDSLHKLEKEDGDDVYYLEETNEFVVVSTDGYIRTYFCPDSGKRYFDKQ